MQRATFLTTFFLIGFGGAFLMFDFATGFLTTFLTTFFATGCGQARMVSEGEEAWQCCAALHLLHNLLLERLLGGRPV